MATPDRKPSIKEGIGGKKVKALLYGYLFNN
jgi:hypothetical protein